MRRYLLFGGPWDTRFARGWLSFIGDHDTLSAALEAAAANPTEWAHVVDTTSGQIVADYGRRS